MLIGDCRSPAGTRSKFSQSGGTRREKDQAVSKNNHYLAPRIRPSHLGRNQRGQRQLTVSETCGLNPLHKANQGRPESTLPGHLHSVISVKPTHLSLSAKVTWSQCHPFCGISKIHGDWSVEMVFTNAALCLVVVSWTPTTGFKYKVKWAFNNTLYLSRGNKVRTVGKQTWIQCCQFSSGWLV